MAEPAVPLESKKAKAPARRFADPFSAFRHDIDQLFDRFFTDERKTLFRWPDLRVFPTHLMEKGFKEEVILPDVDVYEDDKAISLFAELPGMDEDDITLKVDDGVLTISGEKKFEKKVEEEKARVIERRYGHFARSFTLPTGVDIDKISATFKKGVLKVEVPKLPEIRRKEKTIKIAKKS